MNFVAHVEVAHRVSTRRTQTDRLSKAPLLVGAALPDLAAIGGFRLLARAATGDLAEGIRLHHRADDVFHADPRVRTLMGDLRGALLVAGVARGPARACGHVGVELLLDGQLMGDRQVTQRVDGLLDSIARPSKEVLSAVAQPDRNVWESHLTLVAARIAPQAYKDPALIAGRLGRILARRPRLALSPGDIDPLSRALYELEPEVGAVAGDLIAETARSVA